MKYFFIIFLLSQIFTLSKEIKLRLIKKDGTALYSDDGGVTWRNYKIEILKYHTHSNNFKVNFNLKDELYKIEYFDYNGTKLDSRNVNVYNDNFQITFNKKGIYLIKFYLENKHLTYVINYS